MIIFFALFAKLVPLYLFIALGWFAGTKLKVQRDSVAHLLIYIIAPIVFFDGVVSAPLSAATIALPFFFLILCSALSLLFFLLAKPLWKDATRNLAAFATADGNTGYFGIPVALALFGEQSLSYIVLGSIGFVLYENTVGYFLLARSNSSVRESVRKVMRLPTIYAFLAGLLFQCTPFDIPDVLRGTILNVRGAYTMLGMMMIGLGLAGLRLNELDGKLLAFTSLGKFIIWPVVMFGIVAADMRFFHIYEADVHQVMLLLSMVPLATNTVALSTMAKVHPQKAAVAVLASTVVALLFIPAMAGVFLT